MTHVSGAAKAHGSPHAIVLAAGIAMIVGAGLSAATALRSGPALASIPRLDWRAAAGRAAPSSVAIQALQATRPTGAAAPFILTVQGAERERAVRCLTDAVYYEAALEPEDGQRAVAQVVLNRVRDPNFPKSVCGVVFQGWNQPPGCQFSFTCDGSLARPPMAEYWRRARSVAERALNGDVMGEVGTATHYHTNYVSPWWRTTVVRIAQVGAHIFYRWPGAAGLPGAFTGRYAGGEFRISDAVLSGRALPPKVLTAAATPDDASAQKIAVSGPSAPGGATARVHTILVMTAGRAAPTAAQVAQINAAIERNFPAGEFPLPAPAVKPVGAAPAPEHAAPEPTLPAKPPAAAKVDGAAPVQTSAGS